MSPGIAQPCAPAQQNDLPMADDLFEMRQDLIRLNELLKKQGEPSTNETSSFANQTRTDGDYDPELQAWLDDPEQTRDTVESLFGGQYRTYNPLWFAKGWYEKQVASDADNVILAARAATAVVKIELYEAALEAIEKDHDGWLYEHGKEEAFFRRMVTEQKVKIQEQLEVEKKVVRKVVFQKLDDEESRLRKRLLEIGQERAKLEGEDETSGSLPSSIVEGCRG